MTGILLRFARRQPFSSAFALLLAVFAAFNNPVFGPSRQIRQLFGGGFESVVDNRHFWAPITSAFLTDNGAELLVAVPVALVVLGFAERLMGTRRTIFAFFVTAVTGAGLGLLLQALGVANGELWARGVSELDALDSFTPVAGCIMAASAFAGPLWSRRLRVLTFSTTIVFVLFSGQPSDIYRLIAALSGLVIGVLFRPDPINLTWRRSSHHEGRALLAAISGVAAIGPVITMFSGGRFGILAPLGLLLTQEVPYAADVVDRCSVGNVTRQCLHELTLARIDGLGPVLVTLLPMVGLLIAAFGMARGRRFGAWLSIVLNTALSLIAGWYYGLVPIIGQAFVWRFRSSHYWEVALVLIVSILVPLVLAILIAANLHRFTVVGSAGARKRFIVTTVTSFVVIASLYVGVGWLLRDGFRPHVSFLDIVTDVPERFIPIGFLRGELLSFLPTRWDSALLYQWVGPVFWCIVIAAAIKCMRSSSLGLDSGQGTALKAILARGGGGSLSYMATWEGNSLWFTRSRTVVVAYRVVGGVAITTTEPIGPPEEIPAAIAEFAVMCDDHGWVPVFYSYHENWQPLFAQMGWQSMRIAEETVLRPRSWDTSGKKWQDIRSSISRADRAGVHAEWTSYRALTPSMAGQIAEISEQWVKEKELPELEFTLGGLEELRDPAVRLMLAIDGGDRVQAVTSWLPSYRSGTIVGWTLDFMRRRPESMNGVMEFVIAKTAQAMAENPAIEFLSLSAAPLAPPAGAAGEERAGSLAARLLDFMGRTLEPVYGFRSLLNFKRKFQPEFQPLFMAFPDPVALPAIGLALARAYLPTMTWRETLSFVRGLGGPAPVKSTPRGRSKTPPPPAALAVDSDPVSIAPVDTAPVRRAQIGSAPVEPARSTRARLPKPRPSGG
ncbi:MAG: DUF2156 domain-containing protein [Microbacteriaceae bacterium]|nr:DUF2156 domain-containing protein [Microbacteriaceae bacterium]